MHTLLVHGGGHGAWCWDGVRAELGVQGIASSALDLPGSGSDPTPRGGIDLDAYISSVIARVDAIEDDVAIVAHSLAGLTATAVGAARPDRISRVIFLAAMIMDTGERGIDSIPEDRRPNYFDMAMQSEDNSFTPPFEEACKRFFPGASEIEARRFYNQLTPQPLGPYLQPNPAGADALVRSGVSASYVLLSQDLTFRPPVARKFAAKVDCAPIEASGDHCWMLTDPDACARQIADLL